VRPLPFEVRLAARAMVTSNGSRFDPRLPLPTPAKPASAEYLLSDARQLLVDGGRALRHWPMQCRQRTA
jgi:hypothetical protein